MNNKKFWDQVEQRVVENRGILTGGMPKQLAPVLEEMGLHYWKVGLLTSLTVTLVIWGFYYEWMMIWVRGMIWR